MPKRCIEPLGQRGGDWPEEKYAGLGPENRQEKAELNTMHPETLAFAKECFRIGIVTKIPTFMKESFLSNSSIENEVIDAVLDLPLHAFVFNFDESNDAHVKWAVAAWEADFWAPYDSECYKCGEIGSIEFAIAMAQFELTDLKERFCHDEDEKWSADQGSEKCLLISPECPHTRVAIGTVASNSITEE